MFDLFNTDSKSESEGIWIDYGSHRVLVGRAGGANKKYQSCLEKITKPFRRALASGRLSNEQSKKLLYEVYANAVVFDWEIKGDNGEWKKGIHKEDGGILEVTPANILLTFNLLPDQFLDIQSAVEGIELFRQEELEEDSKNL
jgi:hypothetical protein